SRTPHHAEHAGTSYHFCNPRCRERFVADPRRFLEPRRDAHAEAPPGTEYTCPMHPDVVQVGPGTCPKCGMALEPVLPTEDEGENPELTDFRRRFRWTLPLSAAVLVLAMGGEWLPLDAGVRTWLQLLLATPVVLWRAGRSSSAGRSRSPTAVPTCGR